MTTMGAPSPARPSTGARRTLLLALLALALVVCTPPAHAHQPPTPPTPAQPQAHHAAATGHERWYTIEMFGARAGWMSSIERADDTGTITSESQAQINVRRGPINLSIVMSGRFVETADGKPLSMRTVQRMGATDVTQEYTFTPEGPVEVESVQAGVRSRATLPRPEGAWLTPAAASRYAQQRFRSGAKEISVRTIDPMTGLTVVSSTRRVQGEARISVDGREIDAIRTSVETSVAPGVTSTEYVDAAGALLRSETTMGGMAVVSHATTREKALEPFAGEIPEIFVSTFISPDKPIDNPRAARRALFAISVDEGTLATPPQTGSQRVAVRSAQEALVTIDLDTLSPAPPEDAANPAFLASTAMCNTQDDEIIRLARRALARLPQDAGPGERAEACRAFVHRFIRQKSLGVGMATATEVARSREGDCTEHSVLLAALLRANNIPARVASGLVYVDEMIGQRAIFGYHMWTQALIEIDGAPRWVDLDAAIPGSPSSDATHIALGLSDLADGDVTQSMISVALNLGRLRVRVIEVAHAPATAPAPADQP